MKKYFLYFFLLIISLAASWYVLKTSPPFPGPPPDSVQSMEPADTETPLRRAYFTNYTREQVVDHYLKQYDYLPTLRLNYPPEDAQTLIRDQTRSVYLEELVHPFRESIYINGFEARQAKDDIWYKGVHFNAKITIKYAPSSRATRAAIGLGTAFTLFLIAREYLRLWKH